MSGRSRSGAPQGGAGAGVFLAIVSAVVGGGSLLIWIAGAIGGVAAGHGPVLVTLSDAGTVLAKLPATSTTRLRHGRPPCATSCRTARRCSRR